MKILILTHALRTNYGGLLQAYALQEVLRRMGHDVVTDKKSHRGTNFKSVIKQIIKRTIKGGILRDKDYFPIFSRFHTQKRYLLIAENTERFVTNHINTVEFFNDKNGILRNNIEQFDVIIIGSDQVWRKEYIANLEDYFFGFLDNKKNIKQIFYAASFGVDDIDSNNDPIYRKCFDSLNENQAISVREDSAVRILKKQAGRDSIHVLDPTQLLDKEDYISLIEEKDKEEQENILMTYILDKSDEKTKMINDLSSRLELGVFDVMPNKHYTRYINHDIDEIKVPSVSKWLSGFRDAEFVITDSFHGVAFSIIFNKPFIAIANKNRGVTRFTSILKLFGLDDRLVYNYNDFQNLEELNIDFQPINEIREEWKAKSMNFLKTNLK